MPPVGLEPTISAGERPQTYALDRAATGTGNMELVLGVKNSKSRVYREKKNTETQNLSQQSAQSTRKVKCSQSYFKHLLRNDTLSISGYADGIWSLPTGRGI